MSSFRKQRELLNLNVQSIFSNKSIPPNLRNSKAVEFPKIAEEALGTML